MLEASTLYVYMFAALALLVVPGPAVIYIVTRSIDQGRRAGLVSVAGIHLGTVVHVVAAAGGLSAIVARSAVAFTTIKLAGAGYLLALGVIRLLRGGPDGASDLGPDSDGRIFWQGIVVNVLNPKTALFFLAFLPQFIDPRRGSVGLQTLVLGALFIALGILSDGAYALLAGGAGTYLRRSRSIARLQRWFAGCTYIGLGLAAAISGTKRAAS
jgi:threonine/homoserine/homoserine lactone efflux protein